MCDLNQNYNLLTPKNTSWMYKELFYILSPKPAPEG